MSAQYEPPARTAIAYFCHLHDMGDASNVRHLDGVELSQVETVVPQISDGDVGRVQRSAVRLALQDPSDGRVQFQAHPCKRFRGRHVEKHKPPITTPYVWRGDLVDQAGALS